MTKSARDMSCRQEAEEIVNQSIDPRCPTCSYNINKWEIQQALEKRDERIAKLREALDKHILEVSEAINGFVRGFDQTQELRDANKAAKQALDEDNKEINGKV